MFRLPHEAILRGVRKNGCLKHGVTSTVCVTPGVHKKVACIPFFKKTMYTPTPEDGIMRKPKHM
jgi:hypothetical protein